MFPTLWIDVPLIVHADHFLKMYDHVTANPLEPFWRHPVERAPRLRLNAVGFEIAPMVRIANPPIQGLRQELISRPRERASSRPDRMLSIALVVDFVVVQPP